MDRYSHSPTTIVLTPLPRGPFLEVGGFSKGYESVLPNLRHPEDEFFSAGADIRVSRKTGILL